MSKKQILFDEAGRRKVLNGVSILARAVKVTIGPKGRNVMIDKKFGAPKVTKDGVTVAKEIELDDPYENMGAQMVREVASKTADKAAMAPPPRPSWPKPSTRKASVSSPPAPTRSSSSVASTRPPKPSSRNSP